MGNRFSFLLSVEEMSSRCDKAQTGAWKQFWNVLDETERNERRKEIKKKIRQYIQSVVCV